MTVTENGEKKSERIVDYDGAFDENLLRAGYGKEVHRRKQGNEYYEGNFTNDAYHGLGYYKNDSIFNNKWTYEGSFFSNAKEGYGLLSLSDNTYFDVRKDGKNLQLGLYENDRPFGPGVLTRSNGEQDVGFWQSSSIIRLIQPILGEVEELSTTPTYRAFMTKFKNVVEVAPPNTVALQVAQEINLPEEVAPKLYSIYCKDPRNFLFNYEQFEQKYFGDLRKMNDLLQVLSEDDFSMSTIMLNVTEEGQTVAEHQPNEHNGEKPVNRPSQIGVTDTEITLCWDRIRKRINLLLAWNNTPIMIDIMVHTFINRIYETIAGFNVVDLICNKRQYFAAPGPMEQACRGLLESSNSGNLREFTWLLFSNKLNINLQDSKGNGCVIRAASQDRHPLLYLLFLYGANMDTENDEGFTALNHTITRYLALLHTVSDWCTAFLPPLAEHMNSVKARVWRKCSVVTERKGSVRASDWKGTKSKSSTNKFSKDIHRKNTSESKEVYIFDLSPAAGILRRQSSTLAKKREARNRASPTKSSKKTQSEEGWLTPLHVLCLAKPHHAFPKIMDILLEYGADPNAQASVDFAQKTKQFVLRGNSETSFQITGLTPLEALLLRADGSFVPGKEILKELLLKLHDITNKNPKYFGHSFLSLAVIRMNLAFIFTLLHIFGEDPNEFLNQQWGNVATAYLKYLGMTKNPEAIITLIELEQAGMNPLQIVETSETGEEENVINFALKMANLVDHSSRRKGTHEEKSVLTKRVSVSPKVSVETYRRKNSSVDNKSDETTKRSTLPEKNLGEGPRRSILIKNSTDTNIKAVYPRNQGTRTRRPEKELLKKVALLQDLGRDKVDKYIRGLVMRRLISYLRHDTLKKKSEGEVFHHNDYAIRQAINWFYPTTTSMEEEFIRILTHNILAGLTFISLEQVEQIFSIISWEQEEHPVLPQKPAIHKDSLKPADKVLLNQLKEAIKSQLDAGVSIEHLNLTKKKLREKSIATLKPRQNSHGSKISSPHLDDETSNYSTTSKTQVVGSIEDDELNERQKEDGEHNDSIARMVIETKRTGFIEKLKPLLTMCSPQVRWAEHYGTKFIRIPKRATFSKDQYPEVDKNQHLYTVCYKCMKRDQGLQLCPLCKMIWYCSSKCNVRDVMNVNSNHRCKADFYGRENRWRHYGFDEDGNLLRILREGQEDWEDEDTANDKLMKKYGGKHSFDADGVPRDMLSKNVDPRSGNPLSNEYRRDTSSKGKVGIREGSRYHGSKVKTKEVQAAEKFPGERERTEEERKWKKDSKREKAKIRLKEKKELLLREAKRMRELRKRIPQGLMGDFMKWGFTAIKYVQEKSWYKKHRDQDDLNLFGHEDTGATISDDQLRLVHQLQVLQGLAGLFGSKFNLRTLFPWVVLRDGELYYKFHSTSFVLENYSFN